MENKENIWKSFAGVNPRVYWDKDVCLDEREAYTFSFFSEVLLLKVKMS